ncbi:TRAP transporter small permease subunit [Thermodesulfatator atlanticus]
MKKLAFAIDTLTRKIASLLACFCLLMILLGFFNALLRKFSQSLGVNLSSNFYLELQWYLYSLIFTFGISYTLLAKEHVRIDIFYAKFSEKTKTLLDFLAILFVYIPAVIVLIYLTFPMVVESLRIKEMSPDPGGLPRYPLKIAFLISLFLLLLQSLSELIKTWFRLRGDHGS